MIASDGSPESRSAAGRVERAMQGADAFVGRRAAPSEGYPAGRQSSRPPGRAGERIAIVAATETALKLRDKLVADASGGTEVIGIYDDRLGRRTDAAEKLPIEGSVADLLAYTREHDLDHVILALPPSARQRVDYYLDKLRALPVQVTIVQDVDEVGIEDGKVRWMAGERLVVLMDRPISRLGIALKRAMDIAIASVALLVAAPFLALAAIAIALESKGGVLFRQQRIGFNNRPFVVLKLRTMAADSHGQDGSAAAVRGDPRVTRVGAILRRTSIDELPQLLNVLDGSMSLVGPRPQAVNMRIGDRRYSEAVAEYVVRHKVRPGLTGWAQINGTRAGIYTLEQAARAVELDLHYVQNWSLWLDLRILFRTFGMVVTGRDAF